MAIVNANPTSDYDANFLRSVGAINYALVDEGMTRPNTADYTYILDADTTPVNEIYGFTLTDNGEEIVSIQLRAYLARALLSAIVYKFVIKDDAGNSWESASNIIPPIAIFAEQNETLTLDPFKDPPAPFSWGAIASYKFGIIATDGSVDVLQLATFALKIDTTPISGNKRISDGLINIR